MPKPEEEDGVTVDDGASRAAHESETTHVTWLTHACRELLTKFRSGTLEPAAQAVLAFLALAQRASTEHPANAADYLLQVIGRADLGVSSDRDVSAQKMLTQGLATLAAKDERSLSPEELLVRSFFALAAVAGGKQNPAQWFLETLAKSFEDVDEGARGRFVAKGSQRYERLLPAKTTPSLGRPKHRSGSAPHLTRRQVIASIGAFASLPLLGRVAAATIDREFPTLSERLLKSNRLSMALDPQRLAMGFLTAPGGQLSQLYQLFPVFPLTATEALTHVGKVSDQSLVAEIITEANAHRRRALPAVTAVHSIGMLAADDLAKDAELEPLWDTLVRVHDDAFTLRPHREVLEILWQNATAAFVRSEQAWRAVAPPIRVFELAKSVCVECLRGERLLLPAAFCAWQFVLTATSSPRWQPSSREASIVRDILNEATQADREAGIWFLELQRHYIGIDVFDQTLPQNGELVIGRQARQQWREVADLSMLMRVHLEQSLSLVKHGSLESRFEQVGAEADRVSTILAAFATTYGFDVESLRRIATSFGLKDLADYCYQFDIAVPTETDRMESPDLGRILSTLTPFRETAEHIAATDFPVDAQRAIGALESAARHDDVEERLAALSVIPIAFIRDRFPGLPLKPEMFWDTLAPAADPEFPPLWTFVESANTPVQIPGDVATAPPKPSLHEQETALNTAATAPAEEEKAERSLADTLDNRLRNIEDAIGRLQLTSSAQLGAYEVEALAFMLRTLVQAGVELPVRELLADDRSAGKTPHADHHQRSRSDVPSPQQDDVGKSPGGGGHPIDVGPGATDEQRDEGQSVPPSQDPPDAHQAYLSKPTTSQDRSGQGGEMGKSHVQASAPLRPPFDEMAFQRVASGYQEDTVRRARRKLLLASWAHEPRSRWPQELLPGRGITPSFDPSEMKRIREIAQRYYSEIGQHR